MPLSLSVPPPLQPLSSAVTPFSAQQRRSHERQRVALGEAAAARADKQRVLGEDEELLSEGADYSPTRANLTDAALPPLRGTAEVEAAVPPRPDAALDATHAQNISIDGVSISSRGSQDGEESSDALDGLCRHPRAAQPSVVTPPAQPQTSTLLQRPPLSAAQQERRDSVLNELFPPPPPPPPPPLAHHAAPESAVPGAGGVAGAASGERRPALPAPAHPVNSAAFAFSDQEQDGDDAGVQRDRVRRERVRALVAEKEATATAMEELQELFNALTTDYDNVSRSARGQSLALETLRQHTAAVEAELAVVRTRAAAQAEKISRFNAEWEAKTDHLRRQHRALASENAELLRQRDELLEGHRTLRRQLEREQQSLADAALEHEKKLRQQRSEVEAQVKEGVRAREDLLRAREEDLARESRQLEDGLHTVAAENSAAKESADHLRWRLKEQSRVLEKKELMLAQLDRALADARATADDRERAVVAERQTHAQWRQDREASVQAQLQELQRRCEAAEADRTAAVKELRAADRRHATALEELEASRKEQWDRANEAEWAQRAEVRRLKEELSRETEATAAEATARLRIQREFEQLTISARGMEGRLLAQAEELAKRADTAASLESQLQVSMSKLAAKEKEAEGFRCTLEQSLWTEQIDAARQDRAAMQRIRDGNLLQARPASDGAVGDPAGGDDEEGREGWPAAGPPVRAPGALRRRASPSPSPPTDAAPAGGTAESRAAAREGVPRVRTPARAPPLARHAETIERTTRRAADDASDLTFFDDGAYATGGRAGRPLQAPFITLTPARARSAQALSARGSPSPWRGSTHPYAYGTSAAASNASALDYSMRARGIGALLSPTSPPLHGSSMRARPAAAHGSLSGGSFAAAAAGWSGMDPTAGDATPPGREQQQQQQQQHYPPWRRRRAAEGRQSPALARAPSSDDEMDREEELVRLAVRAALHHRRQPPMGLPHVSVSSVSADTSSLPPRRTTRAQSVGHQEDEEEEEAAAGGGPQALFNSSNSSWRRPTAGPATAATAAAATAVLRVSSLDGVRGAPSAEPTVSSIAAARAGGGVGHDIPQSAPALSGYTAMPSPSVRATPAQPNASAARSVRAVLDEYAESREAAEHQVRATLEELAARQQRLVASVERESVPDTTRAPHPAAAAHASTRTSAAATGATRTVEQYSEGGGISAIASTASSVAAAEGFSAASGFSHPPPSSTAWLPSPEHPSEGSRHPPPPPRGSNSAASTAKGVEPEGPLRVEALALKYSTLH